MTAIRNRQVRMVAALALATMMLAGPALAREPMEVEDTPLDRRILTRPGALMTDGAGSETATEKPAVFTPYYVFDQQQAGGADWLELGANRDGGQTGWMLAGQTVPWLQTITLSFANPADRVPVLFFEDRDRLEGFLADEAMSTRAELIARSIREGQEVSDSGVIAVEPDTHVSLTEQFYLLPILDFDKVRVNRLPRTILEVASINLNAPGLQASTPPEPFRTGITFAVDTSTSMQPYIDRTRQEIRRILDDLRASDAADDFSFGLVGFRSSTAEVPELEYTSREYFPLKRDFDEAGFLAALDQMQATTVSSHAFDEDGLSGLVAAEGQDWTEFDGRYIIYVSDAGMLVGEDNGSSAGTTPQLLATRLSADLDVSTFALFLKTRPGRAYHDDALAQLDAVTRTGSGASLVFPIEDGDVAAFGAAVDSLTQSLLQNVGARVADHAAAAPECDAEAEPIRCAAIEEGYAKSLAWLGRQNQTQAPSSYAAWAPDFALDDPSRLAMTPRVLLTRAQLNDIYVTLQAMVEAFDTSTDADPAKFFSVLRTVLARTMRDPSTLPSLDSTQAPQAAGVDQFDDLGDLLAGYLTGLPYESDLGEMTEERWVDMDSSRYEFIQSLKSKLTMYELYYADSANWIALNASADESERVYPLPLEMMP